LSTPTDANKCGILADINIDLADVSVYLSSPLGWPEKEVTTSGQDAKINTATATSSGG